jgi:dihydroorotase
LEAITIDLLVRDGLIVEGRGLRPRTVAVQGGEIVALLDPGEAAPSKQTLSVAGCIVLPGLIDAHVHFREPGLTHKEDFESGSRAAALGGVTTVMVMPTDSPMTQTPDQFLEKRRLAEGRCHVDFALQALLGPDTSHVAALAKLGAISFEIFLGLLGEGQRIVDDETLVAALQAVRRVAGLSGLTPLGDWEEPTGVARALAAHRKAGGRMHLRQISDARSLPLLDLPGITSEVTPHNLLLTEDTLRRLGAVAKVIPPLRTQADISAIKQALARGRISIVATDHAPHTPQEKNLPLDQAPGGFPGVQTMLPLLLSLVSDGVLSYADLVRVACTEPARIFGLFPKKGALQPGADADLVVIDPARPMQIRNADQASKAGRTPFDGWTAPATPVMTLLRGEIVARDGAIVGPARGRFVYTAASKNGE